MIRRLALASMIAAGIVSPLPLATPSACAAEGPHAVLVIDRGEEGGPLDPLCIELDAEEVTGKHLIELAGIQYDLAYRFGGYEGEGTAVCMLANVGYKGEDCLEEGETYWGYWRDDGPGGWESSPVGLEDTIVSDGDIEGWSWAQGPNKPPPALFEEVCPETDEPKPSPSPEPKEPVVTPTPKPSPSARPSPSPSFSERPDRRLDAAPDVSELAGDFGPSESPPPSLPADATAGEEDRQEGFPLAGALAVLLTVGMAATAVFLVRRRET